MRFLTATVLLLLTGILISFFIDPKTENQSPKKYALISVYDKTGVSDFAKELSELGYTLLSTGGTAKVLKKSGLPVVEVKDLTKASEMFAGRVKTLHPKIFGAILYNRNVERDIKEKEIHKVPSIDLVVVNLYPFKKEALDKNLDLDKAIEYVDIGGPSLLRAAAKNWEHVLPIFSPGDYLGVISFLREEKKDSNFRKKLAERVFQHTAQYDQMISDYFAKKNPRLM